jgi:hypothetical protein
MRGNCLIVEARPGNHTWKDDYCDKSPVGNIGEVFQTIPDQLVNALNLAEEAICGEKDCALKGRQFTIYIVWDITPKLNIIYKPDYVRVEMTTALTQLILGSIHTFLNDALDDQRGVQPHEYAALLHAIDSIGGTKCTPVTQPQIILREGTATLLLTALGSFFVFVFAHELEHLITGDDCGTGEPAHSPKAEQTCDRLAFLRMAQKDLALPLTILPPMIVLGHYESALSPMLVAPLPDADPGMAVTSGQIWLPRAREMRSLWSSYCSKGGSGQSCRPGTSKAIDFMRPLLSLRLPRKCIQP